ncbi:MAG: GTPase RsgA [Acidilobaceae archaeon]|nr:GTPase RsgA [Acidilobaceae archaeon]
MRLASWRELWKLARSADVTIEVLDIRDPLSTRSKRLEEMIEVLGKRLLLVLNKSDLVPREVAEGWKKYFEGRGYKAMYISATSRLGTKMLREWIKASAESRPFTVLVAGYPKVGKSSIINALRGRKGAPTSPVPGSFGYTRGVQLIKVEEGFYMIDTPGIIPVEGGWPEAVIRGMAPEEIKDPVPAAMALIERSLRYNPSALRDAYGIQETDPYRALEVIALKRGWRYRSTGEPLVEEAARAVIRDYHTARLYFYVPPP